MSNKYSEDRAVTNIAPNHTDPHLTDEQRANCVKLAAYLRTLPAEYPDFDMDLFTKDGQGGGGHVAHVPECGTAACAAGHGPAAGIAPLPREGWEPYSKRAFVGNYDGWDWCFSASWSKTDNAAHGAAARIQYMLDHGVPDNAMDQRYGDAPLSYSIASVA